MPALQTHRKRRVLRRSLFHRANPRALFYWLYPGGRSDYRHVIRIRPRIPSDKDFSERTESGMRLLIWSLCLLFCLVVWAQLYHLAARLAQ